jgi:hypothetical protein
LTLVGTHLTLALFHIKYLPGGPGEACDATPRMKGFVFVFAGRAFGLRPDF